MFSGVQIKATKIQDTARSQAEIPRIGIQDAKPKNPVNLESSIRKVFVFDAKAKCQPIFDHRDVEFIDWR